MSLVFSPTWFYNIDSLFELVSIIVGFLVSLFAYKAYRMVKLKRYLVLSMSFFLIACSFILKIIANTFIYTKQLKTLHIGPLELTAYVITKSQWVETYGHFLHRLFLLSAFMLFAILALRIKGKKQIVLLFYFTILAAILSIYSYFIFHLTTAVILALILHHSFLNCKAHPGRNSNLVFYAFLTLFLSQLVFVFTSLNQNLYVVGETFQLAGYLIFLITYVLVLKR